MITKIKNFLNETQLQKIYNMMDSMEVRDGKETASKVLHNHKSSSELVGNDSKRIIDNILFGDNDGYEKIEWNVTGDHFKSENNRILIYGKNDFYDWHLERAHYQGTTSKIAYTIWLNDTDEYEGGELLLKHEYGEESWKSNKGNAVFYPARYLHRVNKITKGERKVIVGWLNCSTQDPRDRYTIVQMKNILNDLYNFNEDNIKNKKNKKELYDMIVKLRYVESELIRKCVSH